MNAMQNTHMENPSSGKPRVELPSHAQSAHARADASSDGPRVHYTAFIRLPFPRGDFVDPPLIDWDAEKDRALWGVLSRNPRSTDLHWNELAERFEVPLPFILQQAAFLYERQLSQVRAQMKRVSQDNAAPKNAVSGGQSPPKDLNEVPEASATAADVENEGGVALSQDMKPLPMRPNVMSRTPSSNTITQSRPWQIQKPQSHNPSPWRDGSSSGTPRTSQSRRIPHSPGKGRILRRDASPDVSSSSSSESSKSDEWPEQRPRSQMPRRPTRTGSSAKGGLFQSAYSRQGALEEDVEQEEIEHTEAEEGPAFLPFSAASEKPKQDLQATVRGAKPLSSPPAFQKIESEGSTAGERDQGNITASSTSSALSSAVSPVRPRMDTSPPHQDQGPGGQQRSPGMLTPQQRARLAALAARKKADGSEGTPSMGSSFSDLEDTSVTRSALEEALLSNMQQGGMTSRVSNLSQALKSRYLPK